ncbi:hypothetical protein O181_128137, partial [Austropuccinia psidii MF-1]|nr:hypothetical protein [Austropuccinia psidii MF-1]
LKFEQLDIKSAFLNAPIKEDVYLMIPQGLDRDKRNVCLKLKKAIYGLKQAPLAWYCRLSTWLMKLGFKISKADSCVFYLEEPEPIWLFLHVDDIGIFGKHLTELKSAIEKEFWTKMLGMADLMLGIKILPMLHCKPMTTPLIPNVHLEPATESEKLAFQLLNINYRSAVGSLSYLSTATRPDLSYSISALSQFLENPGITHWNSFLHVLKYLKGTSEFVLRYQKNLEKPIVAYSDADWASELHEDLPLTRANLASIVGD